MICLLNKIIPVKLITENTIADTVDTMAILNPFFIRLFYFFRYGVWNFFVKREQSKFIYFAECRKSLTLVNSLQSFTCV